MWATSLHKKSKVGGLLGLLDSKILKENFYQPFLSLNETKHFFAVNDNQVLLPIGYLGYRENANKKPFELPIKDYKLIRNLIGIFLKDVKYLVLAINVIKTEKVTQRKLRKIIDQYDEIQIVAVETGAQSSGVGSEMMRHLVSLFPNRYMLVKTQNKNNINFYEKFNFKLINCSKMSKFTIFVLLRSPTDE
jgi:ribosomal protein S18 acetylase RimI-like enzyme